MSAPFPTKTATVGICDGCGQFRTVVGFLGRRGTIKVCRRCWAMRQVVMEKVFGERRTPHAPLKGAKLYEHES